MSNRGWIGVDFDGTLAQYGGWVNSEHCGDPVAPMLARVKDWLAQGVEVRIFTARVYPVTEVITPDFNYAQFGIGLAAQGLPPTEMGRYQEALQAAKALQAYTRRHVGKVLPITCVKDYGMLQLWDDRAIQVRPNTGEVVG